MASLSFSLDEIGASSEPIPVKPDIWKDYYKANLDYRIRADKWHMNDDTLYCPVCKWATNGVLHKYCAYSHGELRPLTEYEGYALRGL